MTPEQTVAFLVGQLQKQGLANFQLQKDALSRKTKEYLITSLIEAIKSKDIKSAENLLSIASIADSVWIMEELRGRGILRASKYDFDTQTICHLINFALGSKSLFRLNAADEKWLQTVLVLCALAAGVKEEVDLLNAALEAGGMPLLKSLLVMTDYAFMLRNTMRFFTQFHPDSPAEAEAIADGFSYLFHLYTQKFGNTHLNVNINAEWILDDTCLNLLLKASAVKDFFDKEVLVDRFGYEAKKTDENTYEIFDPTNALEQSMRIGYISNIMQGLKQDRQLVSQQNKIGSMQGFGKSMYDALKDKGIQLVTEPFERYVFAVFNSPEFIKIVTEETYFLEEEGLRLSAERDLLVHWDQLSTFTVTEGITFWDLLKVQRFFNILRWYIVSHYMTVMKDDFIREIPIVLQSLLTRFTDSQLIEGLKDIVDEAKALKIVSLLTWTPNGGVFDIQYQPMLPIAQGKIIPLNILASSNIVRNTLQRCGKRFYPDGKVDPVSKSLTRALKPKMQHAKDDLKYNFNGKAGQLDVLAQSGNMLFVFECKNSLVPCNMHELRTSYDYIITAGEQLTKFCELFKDTKFRDYLQKILRWPCPLDEFTQVYTGIIMSNRMFAGYRVGPHPVRGLGEIVTFIDNGKIGFNGKYFCVWQDTAFTNDELRKFLVEDLIHRPMFHSLVPTTIEHTYDRYRLIYRTFNFHTDRYLAAYQLTLNDVLESKETEEIEDIDETE